MLLKYFLALAALLVVQLFLKGIHANVPSHEKGDTELLETADLWLHPQVLVGFLDNKGFHFQQGWHGLTPVLQPNNVQQGWHGDSLALKHVLQPNINGWSWGWNGWKKPKSKKGKKKKSKKKKKDKKHKKKGWGEYDDPPKKKNPLHQHFGLDAKE